ncbi:glycosyltransferase family 4 protein [Erythrobacter sp. F6033]|uniref:glycosyltransferase family 4 protein n=1 Tax=Erythrobacter sp. F6033 TaxID=2926401 RepID=UPI001FF47D60|nr:glycosyltransferase family 4 protein [Erythrobacter sp. F6033]MCK0129804.1 glycosyltransferase family 4 protein [Erythrobacter sp. F6033]
MLQRIYTDFAMADHAVSKALAKFTPKQSLRAKLSRRTIAEIPQSKISLFTKAARQNRIGRPDPWPVSAKDLAETDVYFTQYYSGGHGLRERAKSGSKIVSDVFTVPSTHKIVNAECERFPEWGERAWDDALNAQYERFTLDMLEDCDGLFCPAQSVIDDVGGYGSQYREKCMLVPYGSSLSFPSKVLPTPRRVLFAGTITLRKGPQYVKQAADLLAKAGFTFVFAGGISDTAAAQLEGDNIELLGHVSKEQMATEYSRADVFVLPSLAEGSAGVVLEAMSAGLPVVATRKAGVDFADGEAGIYVPECDGGAIAAALEKICNDRDRRSMMSNAALERAGEYDNAAWEQCFVDSIKRVHAGLVVA